MNMKSSYILASCCHVASNLCFLFLKFLVLKASGVGGSLSSGSPVSPSTETVEETRKVGRMMRWLFQRWNNDFMKARNSHDHSLGVTCASLFVTLSFRFTSSEVHLACLIRWSDVYLSIDPSIHPSHPSIYLLSVCLSFYLSIWLVTWTIHLSDYLSIHLQCLLHWHQNSETTV